MKTKESLREDLEINTKRVTYLREALEWIVQKAISKQSAKQMAKNALDRLAIDSINIK